MKKPVTVTLPHQHTKLEAVRRIREGLDSARPQIAGFATAFEERWEGDDLNFRVVMMAQEVTGKISVMDQSVRVEVELPWMLATIAEKLRGQIEKKGEQILLERK